MDIKQYIPKVYWPAIDKIDVESDSVSSNRTVNRYRVWFKDGNYVSGISVAEVKRKVNEYLHDK